MKEPSDVRERGKTCSFLSVFGSSIGGCTDLIRFIPTLSPDVPSAIVCFHDMQQEAIDSFVQYLNNRSRILVSRSEPDVPLEDGVCYIHPATVPLELLHEGGRIVFRLLPDLPDSRSFDHFLISASKIMGESTVAVLLSGAGGFGLEGLRAVKAVDGVTMVQDPETSADPRAALAALEDGTVDHRSPADHLTETFQNLVR
jgi:chemotaxis response regulator CheB